MYDCCEGDLIPSVRDVKDTHIRMAGGEVTQKNCESALLLELLSVDRFT